VIQPDGKTVVAGDWDGGSADFGIIRLNPNGTLDTTFNDVAAPASYDGDGVILAVDFSEVKKRFFDTLPGPEPAGLPPLVLARDVAGLRAAADPAGGGGADAGVQFRRHVDAIFCLRRRVAQR
jgi:hypothetical protein